MKAGCEHINTLCERGGVRWIDSYYIVLLGSFVWQEICPAVGSFISGQASWATTI